jgi:hypothetical protein
VSIKYRLRGLALCLTLLVGCFVGTPMRPEDIEELMHSMNQQKIAFEIPDETNNGDDKEQRD